MDNDQDRYEYEVARREYEEAQNKQRELNQATADALMALLNMLNNSELMEVK
jgi:hypothetical protein